MEENNTEEIQFVFAQKKSSTSDCSRMANNRTESRLRHFGTPLPCERQNVLTKTCLCEENNFGILFYHKSFERKVVIHSTLCL